tara:strand:- start:3797 stop:4135 length:339 start_codon:yes stop_codon:yes gene_type:complete
MEKKPTYHGELDEAPLSVRLLDRFRQKVEYVPVASHDGITLSEFVRKIASRFVSRTRGAMSMDEATNYALDLMQDIGAEFGDINYSWDSGGAFEIADEDMQYWDAESSGSNG